MKAKNMKSLGRLTSLACVLSLLAGCANTPGGPGQAGGDPCSVGKSALAGAAVGLVFGAVVGGRDGAAKGAALGGAVAAAACFATNVQSRQTKTAAQSDSDYVRARGALPREPEVVSYESQVNQTTVQRGQPFKVNSSVELVNGANKSVESVREELVVFNPDGTQINRDPKSKPFAAASGGRYENSFELKLPPGVSQGSYGLKTNLYVNEKMVASRDLRTQVVWDGERVIRLAAAD